MTDSTPISDTDARRRAAAGGIELPPLRSGWGPDEVSWVWHEGSDYTGFLPSDWRSWTLEDCPLEEGWESEIDDAAWHCAAAGYGQFTIVRLQYQPGDSEVRVLGAMTEDAFLESEFAEFASDGADEYYGEALRGFVAVPVRSVDEPAELIATFTPWEEAEHRYPDGFRLFRSADGRFVARDLQGRIEQWFDDVSEAARAFTHLAAMFGATPEHKSAQWPE